MNSLTLIIFAISLIFTVTSDQLTSKYEKFSIIKSNLMTFYLKSL